MFFAADAALIFAQWRRQNNSTANSHAAARGSAGGVRANADADYFSPFSPRHAFLMNMIWQVRHNGNTLIAATLDVYFVASPP